MCAQVSAVHTYSHLKADEREGQTEKKASRGLCSKSAFRCSW